MGERDENISITPTTRDIEVGGNGGAILVSGSSATWTAAVSDDWIKLNATSGNVGYPVAYTVGSNTNVEERVGYVYVSGHVHTIKQAGVGGSISPSNQEFECDGGYGTVSVTAPNKIAWQARPNVDWLSVTPTSGTGEGEVTFQVAPWHEVSTRSGTLTIAGQTFTVFQYGKRMKLEPTSGTCNYEVHPFPITVNALAITKWDVTPNNSWISIVDGGNGQGSDLVTVMAGENPSYKPRTGTVTIGTETFTITQEGRTSLEFSISPTETTASVNGANGLISVYATPDLPWTAASQANWLTVMAKFQSGSGNGNVVYTASPNPTLFERTGTITVTPEAASGMAAKTQTVTQPAALATLSISGYEFAAAGESCAVDVTVANIVEWGVSNLPDWLTASGTSFVGPGTVTLQASANETVYPRSATIRIAEHDFKVTQKARGVEVEYDTKLFKTDGGYESISVHPDGNVSWTAVASDATWIVIYGEDSGTGDGEVLYIIAPYVGDGTARTGTITIGDKVVYITQRAYDLTIDPYAEWVTGNAGAGEIGVSASIGDVWTAIVTEPSWISLVSGYDAGTGSGTVRFVYTENDTGKTRTGKIVINGEVYTLTQAARTMVAVTATTEGSGTVSGAGSYVMGTEAELTAIPDDGWKFLYWSGAVSSMQNPITITADVAKSVTATFGALTPEFTSVTSDESGVTLTWTNLAWATSYKIYRAPTSENVGAVIATITADGTHAYVDASGEVGKTYWYWVEAIGADVTTESEQPVTGAKKKPIVISSITYTNLRGAVHTNPATYQEETAFAFAVPTTGVTGYTFDTWSPAGITADMTGDQVVTANWTANGYSLVFHANGGSGTMDNLAMTYDAEAAITSNAFVRTGYEFMGWATEADGEVTYADGVSVSNLTAQAGGSVELYAIWKPITYSIVFHANGGSGTMTNQPMTYGVEMAIASNVFECSGYVFKGWATEADGEAVYADGEVISNLTARADGSVELYAVWVLHFLPDGGPYTEIVDGIEWSFMVSDGKANVGIGDWATPAISASTTGVMSIPSMLGGNPVTSIGYCAFYGCSKLTSVTIPNSVTSIDDWAFYGCIGLKSVTIPSSVTSISDCAFYGCSGLTSVTIPSSVTSIGNSAFRNCSGLTSVTIPEGVTNIGNYAFSGCSGLASVAIPSSVTSFGYNAFARCYGLKSVTISEGVTSIGESAFEYCSGLGEGVVIVDNCVLTVNGTCPTSVALPEGTRLIGYQVFSARWDLKSVTIPSSMTSIGNSAFYDCYRLTSVTIPSSVTSIDYCAFYGCSKLTSVTIPSSVSSIDEYAFYGCSGLTNVVFGGNAPTCGASAFSNLNSGCTATVNWRTSGWDDDGDGKWQGLTLVCSDRVISNITYTNLKGAAHTNPATYQEETAFAFAVPTTGVTGYTFDTWSPAGITADMTGDQVVTANWTANSYALVFHANGGSGTMDNLAMTYDAEAAITSNAFVRSGYAFKGWATEADGEVTYADGVSVSNLTAQAGGSVDLYAVWEQMEVAAPVITPANGSTFKTDNCTIVLSTATKGAEIYYSVNGRTPTVKDRYRYTGPFTITETSDITAFAYKDGVSSDYVDATITKVEVEPLTLKGVLDETKLGEVTSTGDAAWTPIDDLTAVGESCAVSGVVEDEDEVGETSSICATVMGAGTLSFGWRADCEPDPRAGKYTYDHAEFWVDDEAKPRVCIDGKTGWVNFTVEITTEGKHTLVWKYVSDGYLSESGEYEGCVWLDNLNWNGSAFAAEPIPDIGENPTQKQVEEALDGSADAKLKTYITDGKSYNAYRTWAERIDSQAVKESPNAWVSFALGSGKLLESAPKDEDLTVEKFEPSGEAGKFDFTVSVEGVEVGSEAQKENLKQVFGLEGAATLDPTAFASGNVDLTFGTPEDGKVKFTAGPKDTQADTFFMKVKVNP